MLVNGSKIIKSRYWKPQIGAKDFRCFLFMTASKASPMNYACIDSSLASLCFLTVPNLQ